MIPHFLVPTAALGNFADSQRRDIAGPGCCDEWQRLEIVRPARRPTR